MQPRLLGIFAHPDDETFGVGGTLAKYAHEGTDVHVCIITDGAAGSFLGRADKAADTSTSAELRRQELTCACDILGVKLHTLGYRDSGMAGAPDNRHPASLYQADLERVATDLANLIDELGPQAIVTHDPTGGYFHPDHIKVNRAVVRAWSILGMEPNQSTPERTKRSFQQSLRLYYNVIPRSAVKWFIRFVRVIGRDPRRYGKNHDVDLTQVGIPNNLIHIRVDVWPYMSVLEQAYACYKSQGGDPLQRILPPLLRRRTLRYEYFMQAIPEIKPEYQVLSSSSFQFTP